MTPVGNLSNALRFSGEIEGQSETLRGFGRTKEFISDPGLDTSTSSYRREIQAVKVRLASS
jgi:hypothetical protein